MAILKIARMGHPALLRRAEEVADPGAPEIRRLVADMLETMADADGAGLAAPQVHVPLRVVIFSVPAERMEEGEAESDDAAPGRLLVLVNPLVEPLGEETSEGWEGCLSVPGMVGEVERFARVRYRGVTPEGETIERTAGGFHARVVQHECDHLDGILYPMRIADLSRFGYVEEMNRAARDEDGDEESGDSGETEAAAE